MHWRSRAIRGVSNSAGGSGTVEERTGQIGRELLAGVRKQTSALSRRFWSDRLIGWAMQDPAFKTQLFRFIDVFPVLRTPAAVHQHLVEYLQQPGVRLPPGLALGLSAGRLLPGTLAGTISSQIQAIASTFIAGKDLADALPVLESRWREGIAFSVDLLGETCVSQMEADAYRTRYLEMIEALPRLTASWPANATLESDQLGPLPRVSISIKISALDSQINPVDPAGSLQQLQDRITPLLHRARENQVLIYFDMEQYALKDLTLELFKRCCQEVDFPAGIALQAYLTSAEKDAQDLIDWARAAHRRVYARLIKGAYWDYETIHAELNGWPSPVWQAKPQTDACFERLTRLFAQQIPRDPRDPGICLALGTHNTRSIAHAIACIEEAHLPASAIEFQALRGMADDLKQVLVSRGHRMREYVPIGQMIPGMAYLVRRLLENTSNESFLRASHAQSATDEQLLASPHDAPPAELPEPPASFHNEPHRNFSDPAQRTAFARAVSATALPPRPPESSITDAAPAVARAEAALPSWRDRSPEERSNCLLRAAALLRSRRDILAGMMIREAGKAWAEADADVCEAIDFCEFYAREALSPFHPQSLGHYLGEADSLVHEPRGVAAIISPWNFPLAICTGMTTAALVTGNTAILKPAEQTPILAHELCQALWQAGIPRDVLQFLPGRGETVGRALVRDSRIALIAFTGSSAVGLDILAASAPNPQSPTLPIKHVICEMGGKNAIVIDSSADLDEAVLALRQSAFSYAGQKCSACSRVIVLDDIHELFVSRLIESTRALKIGDPLDPATDLGPLIDDEAAAKVRHYIELGKQEAKLACAGEDQGTRLVPPHIFTDVAPAARIATEEIFGPVLCILRAESFAQALQMANAVPHKLTGGVFSRTPSHLEQTRREFRVGNLYLNRGITGALVGRQPFGGFGLSGLGTQAGGREYLLHFVYPRSITENTLRRGFAPTGEIGGKPLLS